jgi:hypothetical protein
MNLDYTELIRPLGVDKVSFNHLDHVGSFSGIEKFILKGVNNIDIYYNERISEIKLKANFPYFWQGHNFSTTKTTMIEAINHSSELLNLNLYDSEVKAFEFGTIVEIHKQPHDFLFNHISRNGKIMQPYYNRNTLSGKYYKDSILTFKLYDAGLNIKAKLPKATRDTLSKQFDYDGAKHYIKVETHYNKPNIHFKASNLLLDDILSDEFMNHCKEDLINIYKSIMKIGKVQLPTEKKDINSSTIPMIALKEVGILYDFNTEELLRQLIKSVPETTFTKYDKKARQAQVKANLKKLKSGSQSEFDILTLLESIEIK